MVSESGPQPGVLGVSPKFPAPGHKDNTQASGSEKLSGSWELAQIKAPSHTQLVPPGRQLSSKGQSLW